MSIQVGSAWQKSRTRPYLALRSPEHTVLGLERDKKVFEQVHSLGDLMFVGGCPPLQRKVSQYGDLIEIGVRIVPQKNQSQGSPPQRQLKVKVMNLNKT